MKTLELFSGTKSFSKVAEELGHGTFTVDVDDTHMPDICKDILKITDDELPKDIDLLWASPPCECFSVASIGKYWNKDHTPKRKESVRALMLLEHLIKLIKKINPKVFVIENPRGKMRKMPVMAQFIRHTVTYCQYGDTRMKPTDLFSNKLFELRTPCRNGSSCHIAAPRGSRTGTQGIKGYLNRSKVPRELCLSIINQTNENLKNQNII